MASITNLRQFRVDLDKFRKSIDVDMSILMKAVSLQAFTGITKRTPVDTGFARASWTVGFGRTLASKLDRPKFILDPNSRERARSLNEAQLSRLRAKKIRPYSLVVIANFASYSPLLEDGSSRQAPRGMVAVTLAEIASRMRAVSGTM